MVDAMTTLNPESNLAVYQEAVYVLQSPLDLASVTRCLLDAALRLVKGEQGAVTLVCDYQGDQRGGLRLMPAMAPCEARGWAAESVYGLTREAIQSAQILMVPNTRDEPRFISETWRNQYVPPSIADKYWTNAFFAEIDWPVPRMVLVVPLWNQDQVLGALAVEREQNKPFTLEEQQLLLTLTKLSSAALLKAQAHQAIKSADLKYLSMLGNEMRTPLTSAKGFIDLLLLEPEKVGRLTDVQQSLLATARENTKKSIRILGGISEIAQIEMDRMHFEIQQVELSANLEEAIKDLRSRLRAKSKHC
jgi:GAF domain-containing protein